MWNSLTWVIVGVLLVALGWIVMAWRGRSSNKQANEHRGNNVIEFRPRKPARQSRTANEMQSKMSSGTRTNTKVADIKTQAGFGLSDSIQSTGKQKCSFCKKEEKLTFYADDNGSLYGVCKECKHKAERQDMLPL
ncbi:hypothetical protein LK13_02630 [Paenibacillus polymyxa]|uniref:hypothetical protein n=1 Tax=Paenibacillus polymyxa TaxID=1406 RepID=UPI00042E88A8|nr:hypothetical protein [Paenibacillus polymyxa]AHM66626.1 hypothetical protein PPSQR21_029840 [Paenibacillus polymyxa SQR-21]AIY07541.1 hypothetical protein LK13_02630 [Paenibacillus polymyxa]